MVAGIFTQSLRISAMQTLIPLRVPWSVAYSTCFKCSILEEHDIHLEFNALFLCGDRPDGGEPLRKSKKVSCRFGTVAKTKSSPVIAEDEVVDRRIYDWSNVPVVLKGGEKAGDYHRRYYGEWMKLNICPDPNFYEVEQSEWLEEEMRKGNSYFSEETKHYLVIGGCFSFEVLARNLAFLNEE